jgi:hypothetical protein
VEQIYGLVGLSGKVKDLHKKWTPPSYVFEFWSVGAKVPYIDHEDFMLKKAEVLESYKRLEEQCEI